MDDERMYGELELVGCLLPLETPLPVAVLLSTEPPPPGDVVAHAMPMPCLSVVTFHRDHDHPGTCRVSP